MSTPPGGEIVVYEAPDGDVRVDVRLESETVWLALNQIAELFGRDKSLVSRHLRNVFQSGELEREATVAKNATVQGRASEKSSERSSSSTSTPSSRSATASTPAAAPNSASGPPVPCATTSCAATR
jgi:hypothetical protein